jgi:predicted amino acid dehydrogenase
MAFATAHEHGIDWGRASVGVVGAGGSVGKLLARLVARARPRRLLLIGNPRKGAGPLEALRRDLGRDGGRVDIGTTLDGLAGCDVVFSASGAIDPVLDDAALAPGTLICDVARPPDTSEGLRSRTDLTVIEGGLVALPDPTLRFGAGNLVGLPDGVQLACFAETILLCLDGRTHDHGIGDDVPLAEVDLMMALAHRHGFGLASCSAGSRIEDRGSRIEASGAILDPRSSILDATTPVETLPWTP